MATLTTQLPSRFLKIEVIFFASVFIAAYLPFWPVATWLQTYMHPWRPEAIAALFAGVGLIWAIRSHAFGRFFTELPRSEIWAVVFPITAFTAWSFASLAWANSTVSVLHHSLNWVVYLAFYLVLRPHLTGESRLRTAAILAAGFILVLCVPPIITYYGFLSTGGTASIALGYAKWAEVVNSLLPLVAVLALSPHRRVAAFGLSVVALIWFFDIATVRRTAIAIFPIAVILLGISIVVFREFRPYRRRFINLAVVLILVPLLAYSVSFVGDVDDPTTARLNDWTVETSNDARVHLARIGLEMFLSRPLTGIGADNFGYEFKRYNEAYATTHPDDRHLRAMEIGVPERAHNEFVQVLAELGIVGIILMAWLLGGCSFLIWRGWRERGRLPIFAVAAFIGIGAFLGSSLVSSYSFRSTQNGIVFMFLLAAAVGSVTRQRRADLEPAASSAPRLMKPALAFGIVLCAGLVALSGWRAMGVYYAYRATVQASFDETLADFHRSLRVDPENAAAYSAAGRFLMSHDRAPDAIGYFRRAIDLGRATPADYSLLATAHIMAGDGAGARDTVAEAVRIYPFSVFLRTRLSVALADLGETEESEREFKAAATQSELQARSWRNLVTVGADKAGRIAFRDKLPALMELQPTPAVYAVVFERELRFPEERNVIPH